MNKKISTIFGIAILFCLTLQACGVPPATTQAVVPPAPTEPVTIPSALPPEATSTASLPPTPTIVPTPTQIQHLTQPGTPSYIELQTAHDCTMTDTNGAPILPLRLNTVCDLWNINFVERPFTADLSTYLPYLDIQVTQFGANINWFYARIHPVDVVATQGDGEVTYFLELDLNLDGLSDVIIAVQNLALSDVVWSTAKVHAWRFVDGNVNLIFEQGSGADPDMLWARRTPTKDIEFAFKPSLLDGDTSFGWWTWAYQGTFDPTQFIPLLTLPDVYQVDNTCALGFNSDPSGLPNHCR